MHRVTQVKYHERYTELHQEAIGSEEMPNRNTSSKLKKKVFDKSSIVL